MCFAIGNELLRDVYRTHVEPRTEKVDRPIVSFPKNKLEGLFLSRVCASPTPPLNVQTRSNAYRRRGSPRQVVDYCESSYLEPGANKREVSKRQNPADNPPANAFQGQGRDGILFVVASYPLKSLRRFVSRRLAAPFAPASCPPKACVGVVCWPAFALSRDF